MKKLFTLLTAFTTMMAMAITPTLAAFSDVASSHPYFAAINYVQSQGIVNGYEDGTFRPSTTINRAEFVKIVVESIFDTATIDGCRRSPGNLFQDVPRNAWFAKYVCVAKSYRIISGYADGTFKPEQEISFLEASKIISIAFSLPLGPIGPAWYDTYVVAIAYKNAIPQTVNRLEKLVNRGEMAEMMYQLYLRRGNAPVPVPTPSTSDPGDQLIAQYKAQVLEMVNVERVNAGLAPVTHNVFLEVAAQGYSDQMQSEDFFGHVSPDGEDQFDRISAAGYLDQYNECQCSKGYAIGENLAKGQTTPEEVMESWMNSPDHRSNILSPDFKELGIGITKITNTNSGNFTGYIWVQNFGSVTLMK